MATANPPPSAGGEPSRPVAPSAASSAPPVAQAAKPAAQAKPAPGKPQPGAPLPARPQPGPIPAPQPKEEDQEGESRSPVARLPVVLGVVVPVRTFRVRNLLALAPGHLIETRWSSGDPVLGNPGGTEGLGTLQQGYLENSNVDVVTAFVQMVLAQRAYESNSKVIKAADDMYSQVNNMTH
jgi:flagellar motor switch/type III secretory pathway protein FliN